MAVTLRERSQQRAARGANLRPMPFTADHLDELRALLGDDGVLASEAARFTYEADALALERHMPDVVALPLSTDQVAALAPKFGLSVMEVVVCENLERLG